MNRSKKTIDVVDLPVHSASELSISAPFCVPLRCAGRISSFRTLESLLDAAHALAVRSGTMSSVDLFSSHTNRTYFSSHPPTKFAIMSLPTNFPTDLQHSRVHDMAFA